MVRVLFVFRVMNRGGAETVTMNIYRNIDKSKIQFDFLCMSNEKGDYEDEINRLGGKIYRISPPTKGRYIKHIKDIVKICKQNGPYKAIHATTAFHSGFVCFAGYLVNIPIRVVHSHTAEMKNNGILRKMYNSFCRLLINVFATDKIACGKLAGEVLFGKNNKNILIINNGIDIDKYNEVKVEELKTIKKQYNIGDDELLIGNVGRIVEVKNQKYFIKLAKQYKKKNQKVKFLIVGTGDLEKELKKQIEQEQLNNFFVFTGVREDIWNIMNLIDVLVMPSLYEGFPMVIIEALAAGKNCVVSSTISKEVDIVPNSVAFVNLNDSEQEWINAINEKANQSVDRKLRKKILEEKGFSIKKTSKVFEEIYMR